jgi:aspartate racemase
MPQHIGIVACSSEGAALCYRTICAEARRITGTYDHPEVSMHTPRFSEYVNRMQAADWAGVGELMLDSAQKLAAIGADFLICPDNTIHQALPFIESRSPLRWLHIANVVVDEAKRRGFGRLGITGTRWLVDSDVYPEKLDAAGIEYLRPANEERDECNRIIMEELTAGIFRTEGIDYFQNVIERFKDEGCDAVILGCTEIPLIVNDTNSPLPTLDSTRLLARAALQQTLVA